MGNRKNVALFVKETLAPEAKRMGYEIWDAEFTKEGSRRVLRIEIDRAGGITIDDCEAFHRVADSILDETDPIEGSYFLEVSSPGIERELKTDGHLDAYVREEVEVSLYAPDASGRKKIRGVLLPREGGDLWVETDGEKHAIPRKSVACVKTTFDFDAESKNSKG